MDVNRIFTDFKYFAETFLIIRKKNGDLDPFVFNKEQEYLLELVMERRRRGLPIRMIILKARQRGISTFWQGFIFWNNLFKEYRKALTVGHRGDASNNLFDMYNRYYEFLPEALKPGTRRSNIKKVEFEIVRSENKVDTAGADEIARSDTLNYVHLTEVAFYPDAKKALTGLLQSCTDSEMIVMESTANGIGGLFYDYWKDAQSGENDYTPVFFSWLDAVDYSREFDNEDEKKNLQADLGINPAYNEYPKEENILVDDHGATLEKLNWRRYAIKNFCLGDIKVFHQEYPTTPEEAFVSTGQQVFHIGKCKEAFARTRKALLTGELEIKWKKDMPTELMGEPLEVTKGWIQDVVFRETPEGHYHIWTEISIDPNESFRFAAGCDVSEGLEQGDKTEIRVLDRRSMEICLTWHGLTDPDLVAEEQYKIFRFLREQVYFCTEKNNHGITVVNRAMKLRIKQYYRQDFQKGYAEQSEDVGFMTNQRTKRYMMNLTKEYIREEIFKDYDARFWTQCFTFVKNAKGQMQAEGKDRDPSVKTYDDMVFAEALAFICDQWLPNYRVKPVAEIPARSFMKKKSKSNAPFSKTNFRR